MSLDTWLSSNETAQAEHTAKPRRELLSSRISSSTER